MKWITRERPKIDRIACPWLIKNFVDAEAEFIYVPKDRSFFKKPKNYKRSPMTFPAQNILTKMNIALSITSSRNITLQIPLCRN